MLTRRRFLTIAAAASACPAAAQVEIWRGRALGADVTLRLSGEADPTGRLWRRIERQLRRIEAQEKQLFGKISDILGRHRVTGFSTYGEQHGAVHVNQTMTGVAIYPPKGG